jgi:hypothetical protein
MIIKIPYDDVELAAVPLHDFVLDRAAGRSGRAEEEVNGQEGQ